MGKVINYIKRFIIKIDKSSILYKKKKYQEDIPNIDHSREFIFFHIPKTAGNSIANVLGLPANTSHATPSEMVHPKTWEKYFTFTVVRHPFDRIISSYNYHTSLDYNGHYSKKYPELRSFSFKKYINIMRNETKALRPQTDYLYHKFSNKHIDKIIYFENLHNEVNKILNKYNIDKSLPHLNKSKGNKKRSNYINNNLAKKLYKKYESDFTIFGYKKIVD